MNLNQRAQRVIDAYGGSDLWKKYKFIEARCFSTGMCSEIDKKTYRRAITGHFRKQHAY